MRIRELHSWCVTPKEARSIQAKFAGRIIKKDCFKEIRVIAGADIALDETKNAGIGGVIVYSFPDLKEIERKSACLKLRFPYIPGLLSFREAPVLLEIFKKLENRPDLIFFDGQGVAHPRRFGIASHMGLMLDCPSIGCAKSRLIGTFEEVPKKKASRVWLKDGGEIIGAVVRTREDVRPMFISVGHKISLETAVDIVLKCSLKYRVPMPTREADLYVEETKRRL
ncbi:MAG: deoxyribonuclease V [Candidatus Omnitrophica bacterium]|nr:deoxyribonuclease V [Candidatus Omnitrophota bacterium]